MASIENPNEFNSSANALDWAEKVLQKRFEEVLSLREKALDSEDIEGVHEMRVTIRRLRSALRDFSPLMNSPLFKEIKKELKNLAAILGAARDQDVAVAALEKLRDKAKSEHVITNIERKIEKHRRLRRKAQHQLEKALEPSSLETLHKHFSKALSKINKKDGKSANLTAKEAGREVISKGMQEFCNLSESLYNPFNQLKLHELRISAKRLRYAIELFTVCWGEELQPFAEEISGMQTYLGELHDCDIWIENLSRRLISEKGNKQHADFWLLSKFTKKRTQNYRAALHLWGKWQKNEFIENLKKCLQ